MGNQLGKTDDNEIRLAWLAGLLDGEGSISIVENPERRRTKEGQSYAPSFSPRISISNTNVPTLRRVEEIFGANEIAFYVRWREPGKRCGFATPTKLLWTIWVTGVKRSKRLLDILLPYLVTKEPQAAVLYGFDKTVLGRPRICKHGDVGKYVKSDRTVKLMISSLNRNPQRLYAEHAKHDDIV